MDLSAITRVEESPFEVDRRLHTKMPYHLLTFFHARNSNRENTESRILCSPKMFSSVSRDCFILKIPYCWYDSQVQRWCRWNARFEFDRETYRHHNADVWSSFSIKLRTRIGKVSLHFLLRMCLHWIVEMKTLNVKILLLFVAFVSNVNSHRSHDDDDGVK